MLPNRVIFNMTKIGENAKIEKSKCDIFKVIFKHCEAAASSLTETKALGF